MIIKQSLTTNAQSGLTISNGIISNSAYSSTTSEFAYIPVYSPNGVIVYDVNNLKSVTTFSGFSYNAIDAVMTPDNKYLIVSFAGYGFGILDPTTLEVVAELQAYVAPTTYYYPTFFDIDSTGNYLVMISQNEVVVYHNTSGSWATPSGTWTAVPITENLAPSTNIKISGTHAFTCNENFTTPGIAIIDYVAGTYTTTAIGSAGGQIGTMVAVVKPDNGYVYIGNDAGYFFLVAMNNSTYAVSPYATAVPPAALGIDVTDPSTLYIASPGLTVSTFNTITYGISNHTVAIPGFNPYAIGATAGNIFIGASANGNTDTRMAVITNGAFILNSIQSLPGAIGAILVYPTTQTLNQYSMLALPNSFSAAQSISLSSASSSTPALSTNGPTGINIPLVQVAGLTGYYELYHSEVGTHKVFKYYFYNYTSSGPVYIYPPSSFSVFVEQGPTDMTNEVVVSSLGLTSIQLATQSVACTGTITFEGV